MKTYSELEYLRLSKWQKFWYKFARFFCVVIPNGIKNGVFAIGRFFKKLGLGIAHECKDIVTTFIYGDWKTKVSYLVMGFGCIARGQILRGILFFLFEGIFIAYMILYGGYWLGMLPSLGKLGPAEEYDEVHDTFVVKYHDNSFRILLYGVLTIFFIAAFLYTWRTNIKQNKIAEEILKKNRSSAKKRIESKYGFTDTEAESALCVPSEMVTSMRKLHIIEGYIIAAENAKEVEPIVKSGRKLKYKREQNEALEERFGVDSVQASAILSLNPKTVLSFSVEKLRAEKKRLSGVVDSFVNAEDKNKAERREFIEAAGRDFEIVEEVYKSRRLRSGKDDLRSLVDDNFHKTLLALPMTGIVVFTVLPIIFMILVAFTNYDGTHNGYTNNLFHWVGMDNFNTILSWDVGTGGSVQSYAATFGEILLWTLIWAFFATFTNYFLGMFVAMMINKKGIRFKKGFRTILVLTIAIPQFISLLYVSKMFSLNGIVNGILKDLGWIKDAIDFWGSTANNGLLARVMVIVLNIWIGIPYLMLIATGILMNIPQDLYESSKIDGAGAWKQYTKITLPYMLFITGPYLLTSFTSNMNNFNVIYLLTGGAPTNAAASAASGSVGYTDLLITWLFKITTGAESQYNLASVIGILVFIAVAVISLVVYGVLPSVKNEEDFQ